MNGVLSILSFPKTRWYVLACRVVCYVLRTAKQVAANIPDKGLSSFR